MSKHSIAIKRGDHVPVGAQFAAVVSTSLRRGTNTYALLIRENGRVAKRKLSKVHRAY